MDSLALFGAILLVIFASISPGLTIECYQCKSSENITCSEIFDEENSKLNPQSCDHVQGASYCVKTTGLYAGVVGTTRFCSSRRFENFCDYVQREGDLRPLRSCVFSCSSDACNHSSNIFISPHLILSCLIILSRQIFCR
ncbi:UPAR/Ly6 domain-containing protein bou-like [Brevipalpus obovatus]|uniref:UPAR/Ly6 domain-containing protein bou-like n=1 Tax=Brevipalpus obovatus TaxID=246614 RepID=UPI003D9F10AC